MQTAMRIEQALERAVATASGPGAPPLLAAALHYSVFPAGHRIRPQLCLAVAGARWALACWLCVERDVLIGAVRIVSRGARSCGSLWSFRATAAVFHFSLWKGTKKEHGNTAALAGAAAVRCCCWRKRPQPRPNTAQQTTPGGGTISPWLASPKRRCSWADWGQCVLRLGGAQSKKDQNSCTHSRR